MRIKSNEIEIILDDLLDQKRASTSVEEFQILIALQRDWENRWVEVAELEENESILDWLECV